MKNQQFRLKDCLKQNHCKPMMFVMHFPLVEMLDKFQDYNT